MFLSIVNSAGRRAGMKISADLGCALRKRRRRRPSWFQSPMGSSPAEIFNLDRSFAASGACQANIKASPSSPRYRGAKIDREIDSGCREARRFFSTSIPRRACGHAARARNSHAERDGGAFENEGEGEECALEDIDVRSISTVIRRVKDRASGAP